MSDDAATAPMAVASRRQQRLDAAPAGRGDDREARLVEVAEDLLRRGEFDATPISKIASASGISRPGFYFYFASKDELLGHIAMRHLLLLLDDADLWLADFETPPAETIVRVLRRVAQNWRDHSEALRAGIELGPRVPGLQESWQAATARSAKALSAFVVRFTNDPSLRDEAEARRAATAMGWMVERSFYMHYQANGGPGDDEGLVRSLHGVMLRGLGLPAQADRH
jgi:TetR/AcrR family transcriptional regulator, ethionamide resistance regulator